MSVQINNIIIPFIQIPGDFEYQGFYEDDDNDVDIFDYEDDEDDEDDEDYEDEDEDDEDYEDEDEEEDDEIF